MASDAVLCSVLTFLTGCFIYGPNMVHTQTHSIQSCTFFFLLSLVLCSLCETSTHQQQLLGIFVNETADPQIRPTAVGYSFVFCFALIGPALSLSLSLMPRELLFSKIYLCLSVCLCVLACNNRLSGVWAGMGSVMAGYPLSKIVSVFGWPSYFVVLILSSVISVATALPLWHLVQWTEKKPEQKTKKDA